MCTCVHEHAHNHWYFTFICHTTFFYTWTHINTHAPTRTCAHKSRQRHRCKCKLRRTGGRENCDASPNTNDLLGGYRPGWRDGGDPSHHICRQRQLWCLHSSYLVYQRVLIGHHLPLEWMLFRAAVSMSDVERTLSNIWTGWRRGKIQPSNPRIYNSPSSFKIEIFNV